MIYWTGIFWVCTKHGKYFALWCPTCGASQTNTTHSKECCCKKCNEEAWDNLASEREKQFFLI